MERDLMERLFNFAVQVIKFLREIPSTQENRVIRYQLTRSATSSGANYEESQAGSSKADFIFKVEISLREMRESNYWLRIIKATHLVNDVPSDQLDFLVNESEELKKILASIIKKSKDQ
ncbi:four helix bundle protein [Mangrovibacterium marinum]|uniref:Four helix bundle protein n=1 Tax=Mangrovibacterium marinum TaxID=1639118 RepID=A0A2T5C510_9BACT|nr:four helix bundle protein [Mangrovibacterium marinum]PTN09927.1 four helix bundle protein [Mangrovibacterium marinum]